MSSARKDGARTLREACRRVIRAYRVDGWWPARGRFEIMVGAILVQNTRWTNVVPAVASLRAQGAMNPGTLCELPAGRIAALVRSAGCQSVKARRLQSLANKVVELGGLETLASMTTAELRSKLLSINGVGEETADAILCFAFDRPVFVADQYARRWIARMGLISPEQARRYSASQGEVAEMLNGTRIDFRDLHAGIVEHGQALCRKVPRCSDCFLNRVCKYY